MENDTRKSPPRISVAVLCLPILLCCMFAASDSAAPATDAQSAYEPRSGPGEGQKFLEQLAGDWHVVKNFYSSSGGKVSSSGQCKQTMINGDRFLTSEFVFGADSDETTGLGLIGYDPDSGRFTSVWADSRSTRMSFRQSEDKFDGRQIILYSRSLGDTSATRPSHNSRTVTTLEDHGNTLIHRQYVRSPDGKQRIVLELIMTRQPPASER